MENLKSVISLIKKDMTFKLLSFENGIFINKTDFNDSIIEIGEQIKNS